MIYISVIITIFIIDLLIKNHMEQTLTEEGEKKLPGGFIRLRKHHNKGAFLNVGEKKQSIVAGVSLVLTFLLTLFFIVTLGTKGNIPLKLGLSLLLGGAFSNTYDRLKRKYVVDYVSFNVKWKWLRNIVFNISDFCIIIGALITALSAGSK